MSFLILKVTLGEAGFIDAYPRGSPADWKFDKGISLTKEFPVGGEVTFSDNRPDARDLHDFQPNLMSGLLVSGRARKLIESLGVSNAEWLPVIVKDHKGNVVSPDYAFLNLQGAEDAIDMERSVYRMNAIAKDQIGRVKKLALKYEAISPQAKMFRCTMERRLILIREDVHAAFVQAGLTGFKVYEAEGWNGLAL
ncbi:imm11 family protein [Corallococcus macrosporus]|uniref:Immunity MXAN-0049 protein domain-containing protein n=1 Tax=Corallococcus macrosporus DSM 14697 TaxID=1189310 RepID=A0A250JLE5_9BACT|nr:DUF1629 domain-containing protein [Corallococcus macrosporus]ATB44483.1 hypothetical protein MYMAC_000054 [Corallococcus macrosporus DSM 14697]